MTVPRPPFPRVADGTEPAVLSAVRTEGVDAAVWRRPVDLALAAWLDLLPPRRLPAARVAVAAPEAGRAVSAACDASGLSPQAAARLAADVADLAALFASLTAAPRLNLRLDVVTDDACRRFHLDNVTLRLLCTYRGTGTEYGLPGPGGADPDPVRRVPRMAAAVFRGAAGAAAARPRLVHRSPPIEGTGETRLLLALDPATDR